MNRRALATVAFLGVFVLVSAPGVTAQGGGRPCRRHHRAGPAFGAMRSPPQGAHAAAFQHGAFANAASSAFALTPNGGSQAFASSFSGPGFGQAFSSSMSSGPQGMSGSFSSSANFNGVDRSFSTSFSAPGPIRPMPMPAGRRPK